MRIPTFPHRRPAGEARTINDGSAEFFKGIVWLRRFIREQDQVQWTVQLAVSNRRLDSVARIYKLGNKYYGARSNEFGYANCELQAQETVR